MCPCRRASSSTTSSTSVSRPVSCPVLSRPDQPLLRSRSRMTIILLPSAAFSPFPIPRANHFIWALVPCPCARLTHLPHDDTTCVPISMSFGWFFSSFSTFPGFPCNIDGCYQLNSIFIDLLPTRRSQFASHVLTYKNTQSQKIPPDHYNWTANLKSRIKIHINI